MEWYWILLIVIASLFVLSALVFFFFLFNGDGKMIEKIYNLLIKYHETHHHDDQI